MTSRIGFNDVNPDSEKIENAPPMESGETGLVRMIQAGAQGPGRRCAGPAWSRDNEEIDEAEEDLFFM